MLEHPSQFCTLPEIMVILEFPVEMQERYLDNTLDESLRYQEFRDHIESQGYKIESNSLILRELDISMLTIIYPFVENYELNVIERF